MEQKDKHGFRQTVRAIAETILSAAVIIVLYAVYVPFSVVRGLVSRKLINEFFKDCLYLLDSMRTGLFIKKNMKL